MSQTNLGAKGNPFKHEGHQKGLGSKGEVEATLDFGEFEDLTKLRRMSWCTPYWIKSLSRGLVQTMDPNSPPMLGNWI
jgi:hypothetical protein